MSSLIQATLLGLTSLLSVTGLARASDSPAALTTAAETSVPQPDDLIWPRLIAGMQLGGENRPEVRRFINHYRANPAYFSSMLSRAEPFLWFILSAVEERKLPAELALLPAVESSWNPHAISVSSAYGLWQFIPKTGKAYGLHDATNYDARRDPVASTRAAILLLDELHREYRSWPLALAAYNTGGVRLKQVMKREQSRDYWTLPLPPVTRDYVPRLLAIAALVRSPGRYGVSLPPISARPAAELVALDHRLPLPMALAAAKVDPAVVKIFNPALHEAGAPTKSPTLLLPPEDALVLRAELAALHEDQQHDSSFDQLIHSGHQPHKAADRVVAGLTQRLHWAAALSSSTARVHDVTRATSPHQHRVRKGDTLFSIARQHGMTVQALQALNPASKRRSLHVNQLISLAHCSGRQCG